MASTIVASPPSTPDRAGTATWSRTNNRRHTTVTQRQRNRSSRQANISSHVLGFRRNRTWRQAFMPSSTSSPSVAAATTGTPHEPAVTSVLSSGSRIPSSLFRLGRRASLSEMSPLPSFKDKRKVIQRDNHVETLLMLLRAVRKHDPSVQQIVLDGTTLPWQYTSALLRAVATSPHIWRLQLRKVGATDRIASALAYCMEHTNTLIDLDLSKNSLGYEAAHALGTAWKARARRLEHKDKKQTLPCPLQRLNLEGNPLDPDAVHQVSLALTTGATPNLQILRLGRNVLFGVDGMAIVCQVLLGSDKCPVTWLDVRGNGLGDSGVWPLAQALAEPNCSLEFLSLQRNHLSNEGVEVLAQAMENNTRLQTLDLQRNPDLDNTGAAYLVEALWHNHTFTKLKIRYTRVNDAAIKTELFDLLLMNTYGPSLAASTKASLQRLQVEHRARTKDENSSAPCVICFEANRSAGQTFGMLLPCRHDNACFACCERLRGHCHMCRSPIVKIVAD